MLRDRRNSEIVNLDNLIVNLNEVIIKLSSSRTYSS